jgi:hypothetical protein
MLSLFLLPKVHRQLLDKGQEHGLEEGAGGRVEDLGGVQQLTGEDHQGQVIGGERSLECVIESTFLDSMFCWTMMFFISG